MGLASFFFQAEDGIRALYVTGVQTCALPISTWGLVPVSRSPIRAAIADFPIPVRRSVTEAIGPPRPRDSRRDRKSTRLNSSHVEISYAVFCLKKKKKKKTENKNNK